MEEKYGVLWRRRAREGEIALICERRCRTYSCDKTVFQTLNDNAISDGTFVEVKILPPSRVTQLREVKMIGRIHLRKGKCTVKVPVLPQVKMDRGDKVVTESTLLRNPTAPTGYLPLNPEDRLRSFRHKQRVAFGLIVSVREMFRKHNPPFLDAYPVRVRPHNPKLMLENPDPAITYYQAAVAPSDERPTCWYFARGNCRFGANCRNSHPEKERSVQRATAKPDPMEDWFQRRSSSARGNLQDWLSRRSESPRPSDESSPGRSLSSLNLHNLHRVSVRDKATRPSRYLQREPIRDGSLMDEKTSERPSPMLHVTVPATAEEPALAGESPCAAECSLDLSLESLPPSREGSPEPEAALLKSTRSDLSAGAWIYTPSTSMLELPAMINSSCRSSLTDALESPADIAAALALDIGPGKIPRDIAVETTESELHSKRDSFEKARGDLLHFNFSSG